MGMRSRDRVGKAAEQAGLDISIVEMPQSTRTAEEAAAACGCQVGQIVKSLVFRRADNNRPVLLLVSGANRVDVDKVAAIIGTALKRADADYVRAETGFAIGGVAPIGATAPIATYMDKDLLAFETIWAAAGKSNTVFRTEPRPLAEAAGAKIISV
jgi:prolyl-tRNA editing enzyme YbaK/EbsC (Cys-tRNA(Pro) deacylase)